MRKSYLLLLFFIVNIYTADSHLPITCHNTATPTTEVACDDASVTDLATQCGDTTSETPAKYLYGTPKKCYTYVANCVEYNPSYDACYKCDTNKVFTSDHKKCVNEISNCKDYTNDGTKCATCNPGFTGSPAGAITSCTCSGTANNGICEKVDNCADYDSNAKCTKCQDGYKLNTAGDTTCTDCTASGTKTNNGGTEDCFTPKEHCNSHDNNGKCLTCDANYYLQNGNCVDCASQFIHNNYCHASATASTVKTNCAEYDNTGKCVQCDDYMALDNNECIAKPCYYPYIPFGTLCLLTGSSPIEHCKEYTDGNPTSVCKTCDDNFTPSESGDKCIPSKCAAAGGGDGGNNNNNGGGAGTNTNTTPSNNPDGSDGNMMRLNIIYMAIMLMIIV